MQPAANRADGKLENVRDLIVIAVVDFAKNKDLAMLVAEAAKSMLDLSGPLLAEQPFVGPFTVIERFQAVFIAFVIDGCLFSALSFPANRRVDRDAIEPGVKGASSGKGSELDVRLD